MCPMAKAAALLLRIGKPPDA